jgi:hypothetical protein
MQSIQNQMAPIEQQQRAFLQSNPAHQQMQALQNSFGNGMPTQEQMTQMQALHQQIAQSPEMQGFRNQAQQIQQQYQPQIQQYEQRSMQQPMQLPIQQVMQMQQQQQQPMQNQMGQLGSPLQRAMQQQQPMQQRQQPQGGNGLQGLLSRMRNRNKGNFN